MKPSPEHAEHRHDHLELSCEPSGVTTVLAGKSPETKDAPVEPMANRVSLHPFLAGLNPHHLALLTNCAMATHFRKGEIVLKEGEFANRFYLIESGRSSSNRRRPKTSR